CGIVGFKPTFGLVPIDGCFPLAPSYDHAGPMASTVDGCIELMQALVPGFAAETVSDLGDLRVGVAWLEHADPLVRERVAAAAARPTQIDEREWRRGGIKLTYPFDCLGWPALALPCGPAEDGLPASVQLAAPQGADGLVLGAGRLLASLD